MNRVLQISIGTTIGILAAILIVVGAGAAWQAYQLAKLRAAQAEQDRIDRAENLRAQAENLQQERDAQVAECKEWLSHLTRPAQQRCQALADATQFATEAQRDANFKQCLADEAACRGLLAHPDIQVTQADIDAAQERQATIDRAKADRARKAERIRECKAWIGTSLPIAEACQVITDRTTFNSPGERDAALKKCLVDAKACRELMAQQ